MSDAHPTTGPLPWAEQSLLILRRSLHSVEVLSKHYVSSKFESSVATVMDLIKIVITLMQTTQTDRTVDIKIFTDATAKAAHRFWKLTPSKRQVAMLMIIELLKTAATEDER